VPVSGRIPRRLLPALLLAWAVVAPAGPVAVDGFDAPPLGPLWIPRSVKPGAVTIQRDVVRSGAGAIRFELREGDMAGSGAGGEATERAELQEATPARFGETHEYRFSMYAPIDFPIIDTRLVTAQWRQRCAGDCSRSRSPIVAQRYRRGTLFVTVETPEGRTRIYEHPESILGRWVDLRYRIRYGFTDGAVTVWLDGRQVADYHGALGYPDELPEVDFRFGLYRDRLARPMVIYFDEYRHE
jgi:Polysaccharide lyase